MGTVAGFFASEMVGGVDQGRLSKAMKRVRGSEPTEDMDPGKLEAQIRSIIDHNPATRQMGITVGVFDNGIVELTGTVASEAERKLAGDLVREESLAAIVINRILVEGRDVPVSFRSSAGNS